jgi:hypothetical protein
MKDKKFHRAAMIYCEDDVQAKSRAELPATLARLKSIAGLSTLDPMVYNFAPQAQVHLINARPKSVTLAATAPVFTPKASVLPAAPSFLPAKPAFLARPRSQSMFLPALPAPASGAYDPRTPITTGPRMSVTMKSHAFDLRICGRQ